VGGEQISAIGRGICVLLGISMEDSQKELEHMVRKILNLRVFEDESGKHWSKSVMDKEYEVLCVSQFTLQCVLKGNKPDFHLAMPTEQAESFYNSFPGAASQELQTRAYQRVRKILNLRVFEDESGKHWSKSVMDKEYEVLCVSQFTLQCVLKGNKPDFHLAMPTEQAESFYNSFLEQLRKSYRPELIRDGKFGAYMQVHIQNDGPVTIELESPAPGAASSDPKQLSKLEKQQQRKEKTRAKGPSESSKERNAPRKEDRSASSGAEGDVSSEREP
ncbi:histidyl tRNA synthetase 2, isoform CRA_b, partial [Mus musculus]